MELARLVEALSAPAAYPHPVDRVEVRETHISVVFLAGPHAYKVKKPVDLGFVDYSTLERRRRFCEEEVRLNRRLAPRVYRDVVPVTRGSSGALRMGGAGEAVEWAVWMERLPEEATLAARVARGAADADLVSAVGRRIAAFHAAAGAGEEVSAQARFEVVAGNARENLEASRPQVGLTVSAEVLARVGRLTERALERARPLIEERAAAGLARDAHGDLRLEHVYSFPSSPPPDDIVIVDCVEFSTRLRYADPVSDLAFLVMDLGVGGRRDLARALAGAYFEAAGDLEGRELLALYAAYRSAVRAKVRGLQMADPRLPEEAQRRAAGRARAHWLYALGELEEPGRRPALLLVGGLPGTGKSTLARGLAERSGFTVVSSDLVRKELHGLDPAKPSPAGFGQGIYAPEATLRTYAECRRRAEAVLAAGGRALVDASFHEEARRRELLDAARALGVRALLLVCEAEPEVVRERLVSRRGGASDAGVAVHERMAERWEEPGAATRAALRAVPTGAGPGAALDRALAHLAAHGLAPAP